MELPRSGSIASAVSSASVDVSPSNSERRAGEDSHDERSRISRYGGKQRHKAQDPARDLPIQILEKFSLVTKFARETTSQLFRENHNNGFSVAEMRIQNQSSLDSPQTSSNDLEKVTDDSPVVQDPIQVISSVISTVISFILFSLFPLLHCKTYLESCTFCIFGSLIS